MSDPTTPPADAAPAAPPAEERSLLEQALGFAAERRITLPVFSDVALTVQKASREERYDITEIEKAIESDPVLVAEVLRASNSAFFGGLSQVASIRAAVLRLGLQRVTNLVFLASEKSRYSAKHPALAGLETLFPERVQRNVDDLRDDGFLQDNRDLPRQFRAN